MAEGKEKTKKQIKKDAEKEASKQWTNTEIYKLYKKKMNCEAILQETGLSKGTLQYKVHKLIEEKQEFIKIPGLFVGSDECVCSGMGVLIHIKKLEDSEFEKGDNFKISFEGEQIILTKV